MASKVPERSKQHGWWFGLGMLRNYVKENSVGREKSGQKGKRLGSEERKQPYCLESALPT